MTFLWGVQDAFVNIHCFKVLGSEFSTSVEPFGVLQLMQGITVFAQHIVQGQLDTEDKLTLQWYTITVGIAGIGMSSATFLFPFGKTAVIGAGTKSNFHTNEANANLETVERFSTAK